MIFRRIKKTFFKYFGKRTPSELAPDEVFLDSTNLPLFNRGQFEGRLEKPITKGSLSSVGIAFLIAVIVISWRAWELQIVQGEAYALQGENNRLHHSIIFAERGIIYDRNGTELVWNVPNEKDVFARRHYTEEPGFAHLLGYVNYPQRDTSGVYYQDTFVGREGIERAFDRVLAGVNGLKIVELNALNTLQSENVVRPHTDGQSVVLSIDARVQEKLHEIIASTARESGFVGGAGAVMDVTNGELIAMTSVPEYDSSVLSDGGPSEVIASYVADKRTPFLNRVISGLYAPGSIVKPFFALGALSEGIITPEKSILSTGSLTIENPFNPDQPSIFKDWKAHGYVNMRQAIGVSSDVYFYTIGGGFEDQEGLGIDRLGDYARKFGFAQKTGIKFDAETVGVIPNPEWKKEVFDEDIWRIGDTYNTSIGQYGFQVTPLQALRATAALASRGTLFTPVLRKGELSPSKKIEMIDEYYDVIFDGMRYAVTDGTAAGLYFRDLALAAKTGTAEVGAQKEFINSWVVGFFPYEKPLYAFVILMERAPSGTLVGGVSATRQFFEWILNEAPEYAVGLSNDQ